MSFYVIVIGVAVLSVVGLVVAAWPDRRAEREWAKLRHPAYRNHPVPYTLTPRAETELEER